MMPRKSPDAKRRRAVNTRPLHKRFMLFTEGEQTEPNYFNAISRLTRVTIHINGIGKSAKPLLEKALNFMASGKYDKWNDEVWIVLDLDHLTMEVLNEVVASAEDRSVRVAYSIPCFEYWLLLHFGSDSNPVTTSEMNPDDCSAALSRQLGGNYRKNDLRIIKEIANQDLAAAIQRAHNLTEIHEKQASNRNPSTTVHILIQAILDAAQKQAL